MFWIGTFSRDMCVCASRLHARRSTILFESLRQQIARLLYSQAFPSRSYSPFTFFYVLTCTHVQVHVVCIYINACMYDTKVTIHRDSERHERVSAINRSRVNILLTESVPAHGPQLRQTIQVLLGAELRSRKEPKVEDQTSKGCFPCAGRPWVD